VMALVMLGVVIGFVGGWLFGWIAGRLVGLREGAFRERGRSREMARVPVSRVRGVDLEQDSMAGWSDPPPSPARNRSVLVRGNGDAHGLSSAGRDATVGGGW
jgi:hypothetical protein